MSKLPFFALLQYGEREASQEDHSGYPVRWTEKSSNFKKAHIQRPLVPVVGSLTPQYLSE